jgi:Ca2+-binding EF-hand superfamily protein
MAREVEAYGEIAERFHEFDVDGNGFLDEGEVMAFCNSLGLDFTAEQGRYERLLHSLSAQSL